MQPMQTIIRELRSLDGAVNRVFALADLRALLPDHSEGAFKSVITRLEKRGELIRACRSIYILFDSNLRGGNLLGRVAARLRAGHFNYLSLETALSDAGVISQAPMSRITLMSSGRSNTIACAAYGSIEFVHTDKKAETLVSSLAYDADYQLWRASVALALQDMRNTHRDTGLINWELADELV